MIDDLAERVWNEPQFHEDLIWARLASVRGQLLANAVVTNPDQISRLLESAQILASSSSEEHIAAAYAAATSLANVLTNSDAAPKILHSVLGQIGNFPAQDFSGKKFGVEAPDFPVKVYTANALRRAANTLQIAGSNVPLTDFQLKLWTTLSTHSTVSISAPTSAGKSYILKAFLKEQIHQGGVRNVAFVVPSRALINQVSSEISHWQSEIAGLEIITTPVPESYKMPAIGVFVVTQERLQLIIANHTEFSLDIAVIDEAQSLASGPRGILLSSVIDRILGKNPHCKLIFAGPNLANPEDLAMPFGLRAVPEKTVRPAVDQNIILVDVDELYTDKIHLSSWINGASYKLGSYSMEQSVENHVDRLVRIPAELGLDGQSLIYALGPAEAERIALRLADALPISEHKSELEDLSDFVAQAVHKNSPLAATVKNGVGVHYGRLPGLVRKSLEDAFADGHLRYLVTTSTLLQGVNLPAKNLFLDNPHTGSENPISATDFWNLAGRAGRLGKEFSGNIFAIDYGAWDSQPLDGDREREIRSTLLSHLHEKSGDLIAYMADPDVVPQREGQDEFENTFVKLYDDWRAKRLEVTFSRSGVDPDGEVGARIVEVFRKIDESISLSGEVIEASPTVSIYRQQALFERILRSIEKKGPAYVIPKHPRNAGAYPSLLAVLKRCHDEVMKFPRNEQSHKYFATIGLQWMKGAPLPKIIDSAYRYRVEKGSSPNWGTLIRGVLDDVEKKLRFRYVRLLSCYEATLKEALRASGHEEAIRTIPSLPLYVEIGASSTTMMSLIGLGFSRFTAGKISEVIDSTNLGTAEARAWLKRQPLERLNLPSASLAEVRRIVGS